MEYTQWEKYEWVENKNWVLILVVMEYTQWEQWASCQRAQAEVLILVVMEYTQWAVKGMWVNQL